MSQFLHSSVTGALCLVLGLMICVSPAPAEEGPSKPAPFEIRSVAAEAGTDTEAMTIDGLKDSKVVYVRKEVILNLADVSAARAIAGMETSLGIDFTKQGAQRFLDYSTAHVGERLAIVMSGKLIKAPIINGPIAGGRIAIGPLPPAMVRDLADRISSLLHK